VKDRLKRELSVGDIVEQVVDDCGLPKGSKWEILGFGIESSSGKKVAVLKDQTKGYIMSAYQFELNYFRKVEVVS
jgi:hypothetical protein